MATPIDDVLTDRLTNSLYSTMAGRTVDQDALRQFVQADAQTQEQVINNLTTSDTPEELVSVESSLSATNSPPDAQKGGITAEAHWWGYQVYVPEKVMKQIAEAPSIFKTVVGLLTSVLVGTLSVVLGIVAGYITAEFTLMKAVDKGKGVKLTAIWIAPFVLVPSAL